MKVLIVEDEENLANNLRQGLLDEKYAVDISNDGKDGYTRATLEEYDIIILDYMLPSMTGIEICKKIREKKKYTPILMLTAKDTMEDKIECLNAGADDYMVKPFSFDELLARLRSIIRRSSVKDTIIKIGNLEFNPSTHIVKRDNKEINLTGKEYATLEYLLYHSGQIVTRTQLLDHVWDYSYDGMSNIIDVIIKRIRLKIDKEFPNEKPLIKTIRGIGYKIEA